MSEPPIMLDLFCGPGGAAMGYHRAGFDVVGVDIVSRPNYPFRFIKADALDVLREVAETGWYFLKTGPGVRGFRPAAVSASCPCQEAHPQTALNAERGYDHAHEQFVPRTRELLEQTGLPWVIEQPTTNRPDTIRRDLTLCMDMFYAPDFPPPWVQRHRSFELSGFSVPQPAHVRHRGYVRGHRHGVVRSGAEAPYVAAYGKGGGKATVPEMQHAMGIDWTDVHEELTEAIPPAYTEYIGRHLFAQVTASRPDHSGQSTVD